MTKILKRIENLMLSDAYTNSSNPKHKEVEEEVEEYFKDNFRGDSVAFKWVSDHCENMCSVCGAMDGIIKRNYSDFDKHPPLHPNCHCKIVEIGMKEDKLDRVIHEQDERGREIKMSDEEFINKIFPNIKLHEGEKNIIYTDTKGHVTIGYGNKISSKEEFKKLPLKFNNRLATDEEKENAFNKLKGHPNKSGVLFLPNTVISNMAKDHLKEDLKIAKQKFKNYGVNFDSLPLNAKKVIIDMQYNMGGNFTSAKWPVFFGAIKDRDWKTASEQCSSTDIQDDRNNWRVNKLLSIIDK
ncbi:MAG: pesticin C-terminus-like muramidase [Alphaproteobacteria bacterium]